MVLCRTVTSGYSSTSLLSSAISSLTSVKLDILFRLLKISFDLISWSQTGVDKTGGPGPGDFFLFPASGVSGTFEVSDVLSSCPPLEVTGGPGGGHGGHGILTPEAGLEVAAVRNSWLRSRMPGLVLNS